MKYSTSQIVKKALNLADLANTSFCSHEEMTQYLNDAWRDVFQEVINAGRKDFVREARLAGVGVGNATEYQLPDDFYQMVSLKNPQSGDIVLRATESSTATSGTFEIVNGKLRLYGGNQGNLLLTYYVRPFWLTFPEEDKPAELPSYEVLDTCRNSVLCRDENGLVIKNVVSNETIGTISEPEDVAEGVSYSVALGNGHVAFVYTNTSNETAVRYVNYNDDILFTGTLAPAAYDVAFVKDWNGFVYYMFGIDGSYHLYLMASEQPNTIFPGINVITREKVLNFYDNQMVIYGRLETLTEEEAEAKMVELPFNVMKAFVMDAQMDNCDVVYLMTDKGIKRLSLAPTDTYFIEDVDVFTVVGYGIIESGLIASNGTFAVIKDLTPDVLLNFPQDLYFTLLAANLAIRITSKQNAVNEGLNTLYDNSLALFHNSFNEENAYYRIKNVY